MLLCLCLIHMRRFDPWLAHCRRTRFKLFRARPYGTPAAGGHAAWPVRHAWSSPPPLPLPRDIAVHQGLAYGAKTSPAVARGESGAPPQNSHAEWMIDWVHVATIRNFPTTPQPKALLRPAPERAVWGDNPSARFPGIGLAEIRNELSKRWRGVVGGWRAACRGRAVSTRWGCYGAPTARTPPGKGGCWHQRLTTTTTAPGDAPSNAMTAVCAQCQDPAREQQRQSGWCRRYSIQCSVSVTTLSSSGTAAGPCVCGCAVAPLACLAPRCPPPPPVSVSGAAACVVQQGKGVLFHARA